MVNLIIVLFLLSNYSFSQSGKLDEEKELEVVNFDKIKTILNQDGLTKSVEEKKKEIEILKEEKSNIKNLKFRYPSEQELWGFVSEFWLVKNAQVLNWDFEKPDYELDSGFKDLMENLGFYQKKFKILLINSSAPFRLALPGNNEVILVLSVPFIRTLDLSKLEISLLLFEEFLRYELNHFKQNVGAEKMLSLANSNFEGQKPEINTIEEVIKNYSVFINQKGFSFQQMFQVTKKVESYLKSRPELWNTYFLLLGKIDRLVKSNANYKDYLLLYPSPEMQLKWIGPEKKVL